MPDSHTFCRELLKGVLADYPKLTARDFSVTKSSLGGYEVSGPGRFYHYANTADCMASARAEAIEHYAEQES